jgi:hypothetical protein
MGVPGNANALLLKQAAAAAGGYEISRSVRFNSSDSTSLSKNFGSAGNRKTWTWAGWVKKNRSTHPEAVFSANNYATGIFINDTYGPGEIVIDFSTGTTSGTRTFRYTSAVFRDFSSWYHIVAAVDTTQAVNSDRMKLYVNGVQQALDNAAVGTWPVLNAEGHINSTVEHAIGYRRFTSDYRFNGYLADIHFIDGQALDPSSFGEFDTNGVWQPIEYAGSFGTNGFHLPFSDNSTAAALGTDTSSNGNTWTVNNISYGTVKGTGTRTDSNSSSIVLALPMDGANNGTTFTDESATIKGSGSAKTITRNGDTKTVTTQSKFYGSSGYFDGSGDYLTAGTSSDYIFGTGDFTVECWAYFNVLNTDNALITNHNNDSNWVFKVVSGKFLFYPGDGNGSSIIGTSTISTGSWYHFTATRQSGTLKLFVNGVLETTAALSPNYSLNNTLHIGAQQNNLAGTYLNGYLQDARLYKGVAKYTSNFNPPSSTQNPAIAAGNDSLVDSPTNGSQTDTGVGGEVVGNYCTANPLAQANHTLSNGNLDVLCGSSDGVCQSTIGMSSGKWYCEWTSQGSPSEPYGNTNKSTVGLSKSGVNLSSYLGADANGWSYYSLSGNKTTNGSSVSYGATYVSGDIIGIAFDADNGTLVFYKNGVSQGTAYTGLTSGPYFFSTGSSFVKGIFNFGQRAFAYQTPGTNRPAATFLALCTTNLPTPTIADGSTAMDVALYTGNGSTQTISGLNFSPDLVWIKNRSEGFSNILTDTVRGAGNKLISDRTDAENTTDADPQYGTLEAFTSNGFTVNVGTFAPTAGGQLNKTSIPYAAWTWDAGSSTVTNTQGSITSQVRANASAGFSVVTFTGNGTQNATVGHGLGVAPALHFIKNRSSSSNWLALTTSINGSLDYAYLNSTAVFGNAAQNAPTSTVFSVWDDVDSNANGSNYVAYCFAPVAGYSSFGSYTGNGSADGPFVYTGHRTRFFLYKRSDSIATWNILDTARDPYNLANTFLVPNSSGAEVSGGSASCFDFLSNGFKIRGSGTATNASGGTYVFASFAESPFAYARAR